MMSSTIAPTQYAGYATRSTDAAVRRTRLKES
jgi:hypothetical protein